MNIRLAPSTPCIATMRMGFHLLLEGSIVMSVQGGEPVTLTAGQTFYEGPNDVHTIGRNASLTKPAKFLVFLLKNSDEPVLTPTH
ncbi:cupin domain-containing protein [Nitrosospira sp. Is2]|uniref:cupin domain-containing protein n=1 Tax=Nitrosospira sp. Is2 TaxID=3080532 RepID=UPI002954052D|nr:cupin domain-containing protein [Nitrosospira sp. Is2]WON75384.1 hypothetical protein R5L00_07905 [Nitrosospira sp. Is2]